MNRSIQLKIRRQDMPETAPYWQEFEVPWRAGLNVGSLLVALRAKPVTREGVQVDPVAWEHNCMEEVCGACSMMINGHPRQSCSALVDALEQPIILEPLAKFPVVRDLVVDRSSMFSALKKVKAWLPLDGPFDLHERAPRISPHDWVEQYSYSRCMTCGCCLAACPQYSQELDFLGPAAMAQVHQKNQHPTGSYNKRERLHAIMAEGGLSDCGNAQNCVLVCPKEIPLTTAIGKLGRSVTVQMIRDLLDAD